jgi:hypothetical protein
VARPCGKPGHLSRVERQAGRRPRSMASAPQSAASASFGPPIVLSEPQPLARQR